MSEKQCISMLREALTLLWSESTAYVRVRLLIACALVLVSSTCTAFAPVLFKFAVDTLTTTNAVPLKLSPITLIVLYVLLLSLARYASESRMYLVGIAEQRLHLQLSERFNAHCFGLPLGYHWSQPFGMIEKTLDQGLRGCESILRQCLSTLLPVAIELIAVCIILSQLHPVYLAIFLFSAGAYAAVYRVGAQRSGEAAKAVSSARIETGSFLNDGLACIEVLKSFRAIRWFLSLYGEHLRRVEVFFQRFYRRRRSTGRFAALVFGVSALAVLLVSLNNVMDRNATVGDLVLLNAYLFRLTMPLEQLGYAARELSQGMAYLDRLLALLREQPEPDTTQPRPASLRGQIAFTGVSFTYSGTAQPVLLGLNLAFPAGSAVAVVGPNGAGKTTLGRLLLRHYEPNEGTIELDGISLSQISRDDLSELIVTVPQEPILLHTTLRNNITLGAEVSELQMARMLRLAQLDSVIAELPDGLNTIVGQRGMRLSGGQRQRVAIARALLKDAPVILCDEATAALDPQTEQELVPALMQLARRQTTIFITHSARVAELADVVLFLDHGRIVNQGRHARLLAEDQRYAQLWAHSEASGSRAVVGAVR